MAALCGRAAGGAEEHCNQPPAAAAGAREGKIIPRHNEMLEIEGDGGDGIS